ncbi:MAG: hypothetical protein PVI91_11400 [Gammaproteobacteria bacterium]|jgi:ElaB/YqjD/DUF883 family membrane-anchored ribosome-binding protein
MNESSKPSVEEIKSNEPRPGSESERVAQAIHEAVDRFAQHAAQAEQRIRDAAAEAQHKVETSKRSARAKGEEAASAVEEYIDKHPWASLGIAFGAGIIVSSLLRR